MKVALAGSPEKQTFLLSKYPEAHSYTALQYNEVTKDLVQQYDIWVDLDFDEHPVLLRNYLGNAHTLLVLNTTGIQLEKIFSDHAFLVTEEKFFGINALKGFIERDVIEATAPFQINKTLFQPFIDCFGYASAEWVESRCGMVTPRIIFSIINEAWYTLQEGTAIKKDIDTSMKLGTNYPHGPFEWTEIFGAKQIVRILDALYADTHEERYKVCPALRSASYLNSITE